MTQPVRVLQVVYSLGLGGIETWLMNVLRNADRSRLQLDFLVYTDQPQFFDDEVRSLGSRILHCTHPARTVDHLRSLKRTLIADGPYDAIHTHGSTSLSSTLRSAAMAQIPVRIAHSHNTTRRRQRRLRSWLFQPVATHWLKRYMTAGLGASVAACTHLFGKGWRSDPRCRVLYYGIDWEKFKQPSDRLAARAALGIPPESLVIGHVGRFVPQKNHPFLVEVASQVAKTKEEAFFLLVGEGQLEDSVKQQVRQFGLERKFLFAGQRADIPVLLQAMDVFLFPSLCEGLGIALVEAQAAGLPCVVSDVIPGEAAVVPELVQCLPLSAPKEVWARAVLEASRLDRASTQPIAWEAVSNSRFSLKGNIQSLMEIYTVGRI